ncbi:hypothetical protein HDV05_003422 [Chytridiales sp. JEL 0842]|nr:hypothetical protein HDV05_003422 [Chytridiales sp. JEL 0842]
MESLAPHANQPTLKLTANHLRPTPLDTTNSSTSSSSTSLEETSRACREISSLNNIVSQLVIEARTIMDLYQAYRHTPDPVQKAEKLWEVISQWETMMFLTQSLQGFVEGYRTDVWPYVQTLISLVDDICMGKDNGQAVYDLPLYVFKLLSAVKQSVGATLQVLEAKVTPQDKIRSLAVIGGAAVSPFRKRELSTGGVGCVDVEELQKSGEDLFSSVPPSTSKNDAEDQNASNTPSSSSQSALQNGKRGRGILREMTLTDLFDLAEEVSTWDTPTPQCPTTTTATSNNCDPAISQIAEDENISSSDSASSHPRMSLTSRSSMGLAAASVNSLDPLKSVAVSTLDMASPLSSFPKSNSTHFNDGSTDPRPLRRPSGGNGGVSSRPRPHSMFATLDATMIGGIPGLNGGGLHSRLPSSRTGSRQFHIAEDLHSSLFKSKDMELSKLYNLQSGSSSSLVSRGSAIFNLKRADNRFHLRGNDGGSGHGSRYSIAEEVVESISSVETQEAMFGDSKPMDFSNATGENDKEGQAPIYCLPTQFYSLGHPVSELATNYDDLHHLADATSSPSTTSSTRLNPHLFSDLKNLRRQSALVSSPLRSSLKEAQMTALLRCMSIDMDPTQLKEKNAGSRDYLGFATLDSSLKSESPLKKGAVFETGVESLEGKDKNGEVVKRSSGPIHPLTIPAYANAEKSSVAAASPRSPYIEPLFGGSAHPQHHSTHMPSLTTSSSYPELQSFPKPLPSTPSKRPADLSPTHALPDRPSLTCLAAMETGGGTPQKSTLTQSTTDLYNLLGNIGRALDADISAQIGKVFTPTHLATFNAQQISMQPLPADPLTVYDHNNYQPSPTQPISTLEPSKASHIPTLQPTPTKTHQVILIPLQGFDKPLILDLQNPQTLGRGSSNAGEYFKGFKSRVVSRAHVKIWFEEDTNAEEGGRAMLQDLNSKGGTFKNGKRVGGGKEEDPAVVELKSGDYVQLGQDLIPSPEMEKPPGGILSPNSVGASSSTSQGSAKPAVDVNALSVKFQVVITSTKKEERPKSVLKDRSTSLKPLTTAGLAVVNSPPPSANRTPKLLSNGSGQSSPHILQDDSHSYTGAGAVKRSGTQNSGKGASSTYTQVRSDLNKVHDLNLQTLPSKLQAIRDHDKKVRWTIGTTKSGSKTKKMMISVPAGGEEDGSNGITGAVVASVDLDQWDTKKPMVQIQDQRPAYRDFTPIHIVPLPAPANNSNKPNNSSTSSGDDPVGPTYTVFHQNPKNGRILNLGTLQFTSASNKLLVNPDPKLFQTGSASSSTSDDAQSGSPSGPQSTNFSIAGDFKECKYVIVQRSVGTRKQKLVGESFGRSLVRKTVREAKWATQIDIETEVAGLADGAVKSGPDFGQLILAGLVLVNVASP